MATLKYNFDDVLITIDKTPERSLRADLFGPLNVKYIDTPGYFSDEFEDYDDIFDFMVSNMGYKEFEVLTNLIDKCFVNGSKEKTVLDAFMKKYYNKKYISSVTK